MINLLKRLNELVPDVCQQTVPFNGFMIGEYDFWVNPESHEVEAQTQYKLVTGRPAQSWLRDTIEQAIEARGWEWQLEKRDGWYHTKIWQEGYITPMAYHFMDDLTKTLLTAFIEALENEHKNQSDQ